MTEHKADISVMEWDAVDRLLDVRKIRMVISFKEDEHTHDVILDWKTITWYDVHEALDNNKVT